MYNTIVKTLVSKSNISDIENDVLCATSHLQREDYIKMYRLNKDKIRLYGLNFIRAMGTDTKYMLDMLIQESIRNEVLQKWQEIKKKTC